MLLLSFLSKFGPPLYAMQFKNQNVLSVSLLSSSHPQNSVSTVALNFRFEGGEGRMFLSFSSLSHCPQA